jgi:uncharacterized membrane protein YozB (DUF420 family)
MIKILPTVNAILNALSFVFLVLGFVNIKRRNINRHKKFMLSAFISSAIFLISYLIYHYSAGITRFKGVGFWRMFYLTILSSHTLLAAFTLPLAIVTLTFALLGKFNRHSKVARLTLPVWLYVSFTGVLIYLMLYHIFK